MKLKQMKKKKKGLIRDWVESILVALVLVVILRTFFFQIYKIPTNSMVPTLMPGDKIFVSKLHYGAKMPFSCFRLPGFKELERGEVIVFVPPHEVGQPWHKRKPFVKRVIGLPGETVQIKRGNVYVDGREIVDPQIASFFYYNQGEYAQDSRKIRVSEESLFVLGDNSISSQDSRFWGVVDAEQVIGKAIFIWWPLGRIRMID